MGSTIGLNGMFIPRRRKMSIYDKVVEALKDLAEKAAACQKEDADREYAERKAKEDASKPDCTKED